LANSKAFGAKQLRLIQNKIKGKVFKNSEYLPDSLFTKAYQTIPL
jgi:hypothetical protein